MFKKISKLQKKYIIVYQPLPMVTVEDEYIISIRHTLWNKNAVFCHISKYSINELEPKAAVTQHNLHTILVVVGGCMCHNLKQFFCYMKQLK